MQANIIVFNLRKKINFMNNLLKMVTSSPLSLTGSMKSHIFLYTIFIWHVLDLRYGEVKS